MGLKIIIRRQSFKLLTLSIGLRRVPKTERKLLKLSMF